MDVARHAAIRCVSESAWKTVEPRLDQPRVVSDKSKQPKWTLIASLAAAVLLLFSIGISLFSDPGSSSISWTSITADDQNQTHELADGSIITLAPGATLDYPNKFSASKRQTHLSGRAYFEVTKDATRPFTVQTQEGIIKVLGTSFEVNTGNNEEFLVSVIEGTVEVDNDHIDPVRIEAGQILSMDKHLQTVELISQDNLSQPSWKTGLYIFDNVPMDSVTQSIEQVFGITIEYETPLTKERNISTSFNAFSHVDSVMATLALTGNVKIRNEQKSYIISR